MNYSEELIVGSLMTCSFFIGMLCMHLKDRVIRYRNLQRVQDIEIFTPVGTPPLLVSSV